MKKLVKVLSLVLLCTLAFVLTGCAPSDAAEAKERMEEADYKVIVVESTNEEDNYECVITATKNVLASIVGQGVDADALVATLYKTSDAAKEAYEKATEDAEDNEAVKKIGKWVVVGTEQAIKDFK